MDGANFELRIAKFKVLSVAYCLLPVAFLLSGCVAFQVGGEIQKGRMELLYGDAKAALAHFQRAAELEPNYRLDYSIFPEGVWTYVGRAYYAAGEMAPARQALERAAAREEDSLARLYLGLVLAQDGDRERGVREIEAGLKGITDWFDYVELYHPDGRYWDPGKYLRKAIQNQLAMLKGGDANIRDLTQNVAFLGREVEIEIDKAKEHKYSDLFRDGGHDDPRPR